MSEPSDSLLTYQDSDRGSSWIIPLLSAALIHAALVWAGFYSPKDTLLELLQESENLSLSSPPDNPNPNRVVEIDLTTPPPAEADTEFVVPIDLPKPVPIEPPPQPILASEDLAQDEPPPEDIPSAPVILPQPEVKIEPQPAAVPTAPPSTAPVAEVDPTANPGPETAPSDANQRTDNFQISNKDFPKPPYPYEAKRKRFQGTVEVALDVVDGQIVSAEVASSSGYGILDVAAVKWIRREWHFPKEITRNLSQSIAFQLTE